MKLYNLECQNFSSLFLHIFVMLANTIQLGRLFNALNSDKTYVLYQHWIPGCTLCSSAIPTGHQVLAAQLLSASTAPKPIERARTPYIIFSTEKFGELKQANPGMSDLLSTWRCASMVFDVIACPLSFCLSVTSRHCTKTAKCMISKTVSHDGPGTLVLWCKTPQRNSDGMTANGDAKCRWGI